ncbi:MAG: SWIM zinc finger family protein [Nanoarchaeota archaeon]|nr:SWIM zinc finger family protein [Nanoarchaeota archaeon]
MIKEEPNQTYELPKVIDYKNVLYYSHHAKKVKGTVRNKAKKFVDLGLIQYDKDLKCFFCNPIPGYNKSRYKIEKVDSDFECDCQFNVTTGYMCSHILAVFLYLKIKNWKNDR